MRLQQTPWQRFMQQRLLGYTQKYCSKACQFIRYANSVPSVNLPTANSTSSYDRTAGADHIALSSTGTAVGLQLNSHVHNEHI